MVPGINHLKGNFGIVCIVGDVEIVSGLSPTCHEVSGSSQYHKELTWITSSESVATNLRKNSEESFR